MQEKRTISISLLIFAIGAAITFFTFTSMKTAEKAVLDVKFSQAAQQSILLIETEIARNLESLRSLAVYISTNDVLSHSKFKMFAQEIVRANPSFQSLAWAPAIPFSQRDDFERSAQEQSVANFQILEQNEHRKLVRAGIRDEYFPIFFLEPMGGNFRAIGYDLGSDQQRKTALASAFEKKSTAVTSFLVLVQEEGRQKATLFIDPVFRYYDADNPRKPDFVGYAVLAIRTVDLLNKATGNLNNSLNFVVVEKKPSAILPRDEKRKKGQIEGQYLYVEINVADRIWQITVTPASKFLQLRSLRPSTFFLILGLLLSILLSFQISRILNTKYKHAAEVAEKSRQLQSSEERYALTIKGSFTGIWEWPDVMREEEYWSPGYYSLLGYHTGEIPATVESFRKMLHPDDQEKITRLQEAHFTNNTDYDPEYRLLTKHQGYRWFRSSGHTARDDNGIPLRMLGTMQDIHEEKTATAKVAELRDSQRRTSAQLRTIFNAIEDAIIMIDEFGGILQFSPSAEKMFGYKSKEVIGQNVKVLMPSQYSERHDEYLGQYRKTKISALVGFSRILDGKRKGGSIFPIELRVEEIEGVEKHFVGIIHDLTETKRSEQKRFDKTMELVRARKEQENFSFIANFNLEVLATEIDSLFSQYMGETQSWQPDSHSSQRQHLKNRIKKLTRLLSKLLVYVQSGHNGVKTEWIDLSQLVQDIADTLSSNQFTVDIKPLPILESSSVEMNILFRYILESVIVHHDKGKGKIIISCEENHEHYKFFIEDDGPGIDKYREEKILSILHTRYFRSNTDRNTMGLVFVKKIVDFNKGKITFSQRDGNHSAILTINWPKTIG